MRVASLTAQRPRASLPARGGQLSPTLRRASGAGKPRQARVTRAHQAHGWPGGCRNPPGSGFLSGSGSGPCRGRTCNLVLKSPSVRDCCRRHSEPQRRPGQDVFRFHPPRTPGLDQLLTAMWPAAPCCLPVHLPPCPLVRDLGPWSNSLTSRPRHCAPGRQSSSPRCSSPAACLGFGGRTGLHPQ